MDRGHRYALIGASLVLAASAAASADPRVTIAVECEGSASDCTALGELIHLELAGAADIGGGDAPWQLRIELSADGGSAAIGLGASDGTTTTRDLHDLPDGALSRRIVALAAAELVHAETSRPAVAATAPEPPAALVPAPGVALPRPRAPLREGVAPLLGATATLRTFFPAVDGEERTEGVTLLGMRASGSILASKGAALRLRGELGVEAGHLPGRLGDTWVALFVAGLAPQLEASYGGGTVGFGIRAELALAWARGDTQDWNVREHEGTALLFLSGMQMSVRHRLGRRLALEGSVAGGATIRGLTIVVDRRDAFRASGGWVMLAAGVAWSP